MGSGRAGDGMVEGWHRWGGVSDGAGVGEMVWEVMAWLTDGTGMGEGEVKQVTAQGQKQHGGRRDGAGVKRAWGWERQHGRWHRWGLEQVTAQEQKGHRRSWLGQEMVQVQERVR